MTHRALQIHPGWFDNRPRRPAQRRTPNAPEAPVHHALVTLSPTQRDILLRRMEGKPLREIADECCLSYHTVKRNLSQAYHRLGVGGTADPYRKARAIVCGA